MMKKTKMKLVCAAMGLILLAASGCSQKTGEAPKETVKDVYKRQVFDNATKVMRGGNV